MTRQEWPAYPPFLVRRRLIRLATAVDQAVWRVELRKVSAQRSFTTLQELQVLPALKLAPTGAARSQQNSVLTNRDRGSPAKS